MLDFNRLVTPKIIILVYWLCLIFTILFALFALTSSNITIARAFVIFISMLIIVMIIRVFFEIIIILFKNNEYLQRIAQALEKQE